MKRTKILSFLLCLVMLLQVLFCGYVTAEEGVSKEMQVLQKLDIITADDIESSGSAVTRAEFAQYAAKALVLGETTGKIYFKDVPTDHWANGYISSLVLNGAIDLSYNNMFNPEVPVTVEQAYKILLVALGYKQIALSEAGIMTGYTVAARKTGIDIDANATDTININQAAEIIYKAMGIGTATAISNEIKTQIFAGDTMLSVYDIVEAKGTVTAVYGASLDESIEANEENVAYIDGIKYTVDDDVNIESLLGQYVKYVYKEGKYISNIIYAKALDEGDVLTIKSDLMDSYDSSARVLSYYKDDESTRELSVTIPENIRIVYNGKVFSGRLATIMSEFLNDLKHGQISLIKSTSTGNYDVLIVKSYRTVVANSYSESIQTFYDFYSAANNLNLRDYDYVKYVTASGTKTNMPTSFVTVLDIAESEDERTVEIVVCDTQVSGNIKISNANKQKVNIDGVIYEVNDVAWQKFEGSLKGEVKATATLDSFGKIAYMEVSKEENLQVGYLIDATCIEESFDKNFAFKIFSNGVVSVFDLADKVVLDGIKYDMSEHKKFFLKFPNVIDIGADSVKIRQQILRYEINSDNEITEIDTTNLTANEDEDKSLKQIHDGSNSLWYNSSFGRFGLNAVYSSSYTDVIVLPSGVSENNTVIINGVEVSVDDTMYASSTSFTSDALYTIETYDYDADNPNTEIIVNRKEPITYDRTLYMFSNDISLTDKDGTPVVGLECYSAAGLTTLVLDETQTSAVEALNLKCGDILAVDTDLTGAKVYAVHRMFKAESMTFDDATANRNPENKYWFRGTYNPYSDTFRGTISGDRRNITKGYAYNVTDGILEVTYEYGTDVSERTKASSLPVIVFDDTMREGYKIYEGSLDDIVTFKTAQYNCSTVVTGYAAVRPQCIFVFK